MTVRIVHLSDLHFGAVAEATVAPLLRAIEELAPDLVVVSGDLTQRARRRQFAQARAFLDSLPTDEVVAVPGNHDVPLWDLLRRLVAPRRRFDRYVTRDPFPSFLHDDVAVVGINTARSLTIKNGRVNREQLECVESILQRSPRGALRVVVAHHPFVVPEDVPLTERVGRTEMALPVFLRIGVDLLLTGHRHHSWIRAPAPGLVAVHAGTSTSRRVRHEENAFNVLTITEDRITVQRFLWRPEGGAFEPPHPDRVRTFVRRNGHLLTDGGE